VKLDHPEGVNVDYYMGKKSRVAIFIDAANFEISLKQHNLYADYKKIITMAKKEGTISILRYYSPVFNTIEQNKFFSFIKNLGFKIITKNIKIIKQQRKKKKKANFDVEITFDAALFIEQFDKVFLFSGDSDFVYLVAKLQAKGIFVTVISPLCRTAKELKKQANNFINLPDCEFVKKRPLDRGAHNNLSTAKK